jgi:thiaminase/transcriptional activator TenA
VVAAILPCFWIYWDVGTAIKAKSASGNPYQAWIDTYSDEGFATATKRVIAITDTLAAAASEAERARMAEAFRWSCRFEWAFWDAAWRLERWPV